MESWMLRKRDGGTWYVSRSQKILLPDGKPSSEAELVLKSDFDAATGTLVEISSFTDRVTGFPSKEAELAAKILFSLGILKSGE